MSRGSRPLTGPRARGPLLTVGNVRLLPSLDLGARLGVDRLLEERPWDRHTGGEGEARIHLESREGHGRRDHIG